MQFIHRRRLRGGYIIEHTHYPEQNSSQEQPPHIDSLGGKLQIKSLFGTRPRQAGKVYKSKIEDICNTQGERGRKYGDANSFVKTMGKIERYKGDGQTTKHRHQERVITFENGGRHSIKNYYHAQSQTQKTGQSLYPTKENCQKKKETNQVNQTASAVFIGDVIKVFLGRLRRLC